MSETRKQIIAERDAEWLKAICPDPEGIKSMFAEACSTPEKYAGMLVARTELEHECHAYTGQLIKKLRKWKKRASKLHVRCAKRENHIEYLEKQLWGEDPPAVVEASEPSLRSQLAEAERKNGELEQRAESAEQERDRLALELAHEAHLMVPGAVHFVPLVENGKHATRPPKKGESFLSAEGEFMKAGYDWHADLPRAIYTRISTPAAPEAESQPDPEPQAAEGREYYTHGGTVILRASDNRQVNRQMAAQFYAQIDGDAESDLKNARLFADFKNGTSTLHAENTRLAAQVEELKGESAKLNQCCAEQAALLVKAAAPSPSAASAAESEHLKGLKAENRRVADLCTAFERDSIIDAASLTGLSRRVFNVVRRARAKDIASERPDWEAEFDKRFDNDDTELVTYKRGGFTYATAVENVKRFIREVVLKPASPPRSAAAGEHAVERVLDNEIDEWTKSKSPSQSAAAVEGTGERRRDQCPKCGQTAVCTLRLWGVDTFSCGNNHDWTPSDQITPENSESLEDMRQPTVHEIAALVKEHGSFHKAQLATAAPPPAAPAETGEKWVAALVNRTTSHEEWVVRMKIGFATKEQAETAAAKVNAQVCADCGYSAGVISAETGKVLMCKVCDERGQKRDFKTERDEARSQLSQLQAEAQQREKDARAMDAVRKYGLKLTRTGSDVFQVYELRTGKIEYRNDPADAILSLASQLESSGGET